MDNVRIIYDLSTLRAVQVLVLSAQSNTDFNSSFYGMIQGPMPLIQQQCNALGITNVDFQSLEISTGITDRDRVILDRHFGQEILNEFLAMRKANPSSPQEDVALMEYLKDIREMLYDGSIRSARTLLAEVPDAVIPVMVRDYFVSKMSNYLGV
jgi:hypothetical protein